MRPINVYALTRLEDQESLSRLERRMSKRGRRLNIKSWEISNLRALSSHLCAVWDEGESLECYYSFSIPRLGKEFDLLRISDNTVVNVELKSRAVPDESIRKQLIQNRYYLSLLGRTVRSYTYVEEDDRLLRLNSRDRLVTESWEKLRDDLIGQRHLYTDDVELLFKEESFLIEPLTDSEKFLRKEYFLTSQQKDIEKKILKAIENGSGRLFSFSGYPGTGKTMLLFDMAMKLSEKKRVCLIHGGLVPEVLRSLDERLHRVDLLSIRAGDDLPEMSHYAAVLVDEAHRLTENQIISLAESSAHHGMPLIMSCDREDALSPCELGASANGFIQTLPGIVEHKLTNRIRTNSELSLFIQGLFGSDKMKHHREYPSVSVLYANDDDEACILLDIFNRKGYVYLDRTARDGRACSYLDSKNDASAAHELTHVSIDEIQGRDFDKVVMVIDEAYFYDEKGYLRYDRIVKSIGEGEDSPVRELFRGLTRAKKEVALVVKDNQAVFKTIMAMML